MEELRAELKLFRTTLEGVSKKIDELKDTVASNRTTAEVAAAEMRGEIAGVRQQLQGSARQQSIEHEEVKRRVTVVERKVDAISETTTTMKTKMALFGALIGGIASEAMHRLLGTK